MSVPAINDDRYEQGGYNMDISKVGSSVVKMPDYTSSRQVNEQDTDDGGVVLELDRTIVSKDSTAIYSNPKLAGDAQIIKRFEEYTNRQIGGQLGSLKAYLQGYLDGNGTSAQSTDRLEQLLRTRYGLSADLDPSAVEEGGYYSAEATSDRLVQFAISLSGGDTDKADMLIEAVKKGFSLAGDVWGGELPEICQRTYDMTMKKFEAWKNGTLGDQ